MRTESSRLGSCCLALPPPRRWRRASRWSWTRQQRLASVPKERHSQLRPLRGAIGSWTVRLPTCATSRQKNKWKQVETFLMAVCFGCVGCGVSTVCGVPACILGDACSVGALKFSLPGSCVVGWPFLATFSCCVCTTPRRGDDACCPPCCRCGCFKPEVREVRGFHSHDGKHPFVTAKPPLWGVVMDRCDDFD